MARRMLARKMLARKMLARKMLARKMLARKMLARGWRPRPGAGERGSMSVELVVVAPGLIGLLLLVGAGGRVVEAQGHLDGAARDAARAASLAMSPAQASQLALQAAQADLGTTSWCAAGSVQALVAGFPAAGQLVVAGNDITVTVQCDVNMSPFTVLGFNPDMIFSGRAVAPLDAFVERNG
jgi:Flp pilus assembly protein TadG